MCHVCTVYKVIVTKILLLNTVGQLCWIYYAETKTFAISFSNYQVNNIQNTLPNLRQSQRQWHIVITFANFQWLPPAK